MADLSHLSDDELMQIAKKSEPSVSDISDADLMRIAKGGTPAPSGYMNSVRGAISDVASIPGNVANSVNKVLSGGPILSQAWDAVKDIPRGMPLVNIPVAGTLAEKLGSGAAAGLTSLTKGTDFGQEYQKNEANRQNQEADYAEKHPIANFARGAVGAAALPLPTGGGALGRTATNAGLGYGQATVEGAPDPLRAALAGGLAGSVAEAPGALARGLASKRVGQTVFGVKPETTEYYRQNQDIVNNKDLLPDTKAKLDTQISGLQEGVGTAKEALNDAKIDKRVSDQAVVQDLKAQRPPEQTVTEIGDALDAVRRDTSQGSASAYRVLEQHDAPINLAPIKADLTERINSFKVGGVEPPFSEMPEYQKMVKYREYLDRLGNEARPEDLKRVVQGLDDITQNAYATAKQNGGYISRYDRALMGTRAFIDDYLKQIPAYKDAMAPVAEMTELSKKIQPAFSTDKKAYSALSSLDRPENMELREGIQKLGDLHGKDFLGQLKEYEQAKNALKDTSIVKGLQEATPAAEALNSAQSDLASANAWNDPAKRLSPQNTQSFLESLGQERKPNLQNQELAKHLGELSGNDYMDAAKGIGVQNAFNQGFLRGSRNVNLGANSVAGVVGGINKVLFGGGTSPEAGMIAHGVGAVGGALNDVVGPKAFKFILDVSMDPKVNKYANILQTAAQKGVQSFTMTNAMLAKQDPSYLEYLKSKLQGGNEPSQ